MTTAMTVEQPMERGDFEAALGPESRTSMVGILQVQRTELAAAQARPKSF